ncbi:MAG TPA: hypothetical protein VF240_06955 [Pyrinomonadaceae bacterium]
MFWSGLTSLLRVIIYGWVIALWQFLKLLCQFCRKRCARPPKTPLECLQIDHPAFVRPDPLLYSQRYLKAHGFAVTYNNPDISLSKGGVLVSSHDLEPATTYEVTARIWNNSLEAPVVGMPVHLSFRNFGVGNQPIPIASGAVDVGVKGSVTHPGFVIIPWTTPATPGHYCLQVLLDPVDDIERLNNLGQENTDVRKAHSPALFEFTLRNDTPKSRRYHFEVDAYEIPALPKCGDTRPDDAATLRRHRPEAHPVPAGFVVKIEPSTPTLDPGVSATINVSVEPPAGFVGRQALNINAFHEQGFAGGVTLTTVKEP